MMTFLFQSDRNKEMVGLGARAADTWTGRKYDGFLLKRLEHEELLKDLGLTGLPDLSG